jgi:uncharacterized protein with PQ loop repeat
MNPSNLRFLEDNNPFDFTQFKNLLGLFGNIFAIFFFISPISLMRQLHNRQKDPKDIPYLVMIMSIMNCVLWLSYGILKTSDKFFICLANGIGFPINLIYLCLYFFYRSDRDCAKSLLLIAPTLVLSGGLFAVLTYVLKISEVCQYSAMVFNIFMYGSPGQNIVK